MWKYLAEQNPGGYRFYPGVPLRDLTDEEFEALDDMQRACVASGVLYEKAPEPKAEEPKKDTKEK